MTRLSLASGFKACFSFSPSPQSFEFYALWLLNMLDSREKLAVLEIIVYVTTILFCIFNNIRYGFKRVAGWIYLSLFCVSMWELRERHAVSLPTMV